MIGEERRVEFGLFLLLKYKIDHLLTSICSPVRNDSQSQRRLKPTVLLQSDEWSLRRSLRLRKIDFYRLKYDPVTFQLLDVSIIYRDYELE